jgi:hypothetical protein
MSRWTEEELEYLREVYHTQPIKDTAEKLERSYRSVLAKARLIGLSRYPELTVKDLDNENVAKRAAEILDELGGFCKASPKDNNRLTKTLYYIKINAGRRHLSDLEWLVENVGGRISVTQTHERNTTWYIWAIHRQKDVHKILEAVKPYSEKFYEKFPD